MMGLPGYHLSNERLVANRWRPKKGRISSRLATHVVYRVQLLKPLNAATHNPPIALIEASSALRVASHDL